MSGLRLAAAVAVICASHHIVVWDKVASAQQTKFTWNENYSKNAAAFAFAFAFAAGRNSTAFKKGHRLSVKQRGKKKKKVLLLLKYQSELCEFSYSL